MENIELVNHVKSAFGALQIVSGAVQAMKPMVSRLTRMMLGVTMEIIYKSHNMTEICRSAIINLCHILFASYYFMYGKESWSISE